EGTYRPGIWVSQVLIRGQFQTSLDLVLFYSSRGRHTSSYGDWSSDVCSSDLHPLALGDVARDDESRGRALELDGLRGGGLEHHRSEERRVGKECRTGGSP